MKEKRPLPGQSSPAAYAEYYASRADMVRHLPDSINDLSGAMIEPAAVGPHAVKEAAIQRAAWARIYKQQTATRPGFAYKKLLADSTWRRYSLFQLYAESATFIAFGQ
jgi:hypothetical protein